MLKAKKYTEEEVIQATLEYFSGDKLATDGFVTKYALRDQWGNLYELTPEDMHRRMAKEFARIEAKYPNSLSEDEIFTYLDRFRYLVPQGSPMFGIGNPFVVVSTSNCVVIPSPEDSMSGIFKTAEQFANLFKRRCGVGTDISTLRPEGTPVNNAARTSTGAWSFAELFAFIAAKVGQNGRRGAEMICIDVRHPDIEKFVAMKDDLKKATGANLSVKIRDDFMEAVETDEDFTLRWPVDSNEPSFTREVKAREVWEAIIHNATTVGEPGILMWDNIKKNLPADCYEFFVTVATNPCGEIPLSMFDSCRLIAQNLKWLVRDSFEDVASVDYQQLMINTEIGMRLSDDLVDLEIEKIEQILEIVDNSNEIETWEKMKEACMAGRRTGLGTTGLADMLARLRLPYDSDEALEEIDNVYRIIRDTAYRASIALARERGAFPVFDWEKERNNEFILRLPHDIQNDIEKYGRRNISILTNSPTGTVSKETQTSYGIEPVFRNEYINRRKLTPESKQEPDFIDDNGERFVNYNVFHKNIEDYLDYISKKMGESNSEIFDIPDFFVTSDSINWMKRVEVQATIQKYVDHSISSTINLPKGTTEEVVGELYFEGWKRGLKGITVYVDGSRDGIMLEKDGDTFVERQAPDRPDELRCEIIRPTIKGEKWVVLVGLLDGRPYEVFAGRANKIELPKKYDCGIIKKRSRKTMRNLYDLYLGEKDDELVVKDIVDIFDNPNHAVFTRLISLALRQGAPIKHLVLQLQKDSDNDLASFSKVVSRQLKKFIKNGEGLDNGKTCPGCGAENSLAWIEGCVTCKVCNWGHCS
tara:strand:- start:2832 stop:5276 length:2445 start_codon:yes stop_codon:yes gene_type:complete